MSINTDGTHHTGKLNCFVQQKQSGYLNLDEDGANYEETWKGPKDKVEKLEDGGIKLYGELFQINEARPDITNNANFDQHYTPPEFTIATVKWILRSISTDDSESGDQIFVRMKYGAIDTESGASSGTTASDGPTTVREVRWKLSWGDKGATVLVYADPEKYGARGKGWIIDKSMLDSDRFPDHGLMKMVPAMKGYANRTARSEQYTSDPYQFVKGVCIYEIAGGDGEGGEEAVKVRKLADYFSAGVKPQLHYPILTRTTTSKKSVKSIDAKTSVTRPYQEGDQDSTTVTEDKKKNTKTTVKVEVDREKGTTTTTTTIDSMVGVDIDMISDPPDAPFRFQKTYQWLKVSDDIAQTSDGYERNEVWWGDEKWNTDFYGSAAERWEPGTIGI